MKTFITILILLLATVCFGEVERTWTPYQMPLCPAPTEDMCIEGYSVYVSFTEGVYTEESCYPYPFPIAHVLAPDTIATIYIMDKHVAIMYSVVKMHGLIRDKTTGQYKVYESLYFDEIKLSGDSQELPPSGGGSSGESCFINSMR